ncbi:MAG: hypothetical protein PHH77_06845 [Victivallaceae bacterium]|nr:hypothetical protein [Victivallaceae bacterium]
MVKRLLAALAVLGAFTASAEEIRKIEQPAVSLAELRIYLAENCSFILNTRLRTFGPAKIRLLGGEICALSPSSSLRREVSPAVITGHSGSLWTKNPKAYLSYENQSYFLNCPAKGEYTVKLEFVSKIHKNALFRKCSFFLLPALVRKAVLQLSPKDIEPQIDGCLDLTKTGSAYTGFLPPSGNFSLNWKRLVDNETAALAVNAKVSAVGSVLTGAVKLNTRIVYRIFQGGIKHLRLRVPAGLNVLAVRGRDLRDWSTDKKAPQLITVSLNNKQYENYVLEIQAEQILTGTPCTFTLRPIVPENVMRLDGILRFGSGRGVKLLVENTPGLVQIDNSALSSGQLPQYAFELLNPLSYDFSGSEYRLDARAENITPAYTANLNCVSSCGDRSLQVRLDCTLDIKDAPLREVNIRYEPGLTFSRVIGADINPQDYDLLNSRTGKTVKITFRQPVSGQVVFSIYFERELKHLDTFNIPNFSIEGAKSVRGYLLLAADRGLELLPGKLNHLTPVHPGSLPIRQARLQFSYLFRTPDWGGIVKIKHVKGNIVSEIFNLVSVGEGTAYGSSILSFHISGAPTDTLRFIVGDDLKNLEFKGSDIIARRRLGAAPQKGFSSWEVKLRRSRLGDLTLLATYEMSVKDGGILRLGAISAADADFSGSFTALAGVKSLKASSGAAAPSVQEIDQSELPAEYLQMINNPLLKVYRGSGKDQWQEVVISRYRKCSMPQTVIDRTELTTRLDENGGSVTTVQYRVKNSTGQFLNLKLPAGAELWNVSVDGHPKRLSSSGGELLIPLPRHANINLPIAITVTYARQFDRLAGTTKLNLDAPRTDIKSLFCEWLVTVPDNCLIAAASPEPVNRREAFGGGFAGIMERLCFYATTGTGIIFLAGWFIITLLVSVFLGCCAKNRKIMAGLVLIAGAAVIFFTSALIRNSLIRHPIGPLHSFSVNRAVFNRVMGLDDRAFSIDLIVKNLETATRWSIIYSLAYLTAAIAAGFGCRRLKSRYLKALGAGSAGALIVAAVSPWFRISVYGSLLLAVLIPLLLSSGVWMAVWRRFRTMALLLMIPFLFWSTRTEASKIAGPKPDGITIAAVNCTGMPHKKAVSMTYTYQLKADRPGSIQLLSAPARLTAVRENSDDWEMIRNRAGYLLKVKEKGEYTIIIDIESPVIREEGKAFFSLPVPQCITNRFVLNDPAGPSAIKALNAIAENRDHQTLRACFTPGTTARFEISGKARAGSDAAVTFFAQTIGYVKIGRGSTEIKNELSLNIPQGSLQMLELTIPENMRITSVLADQLEAWRFDRSNHNLKVFFSKPRSDSCTVTVNSQILGGKLPHPVVISPLKLPKAARQYGSLGIFVDREVKISGVETRNCTPINNDFFSSGQLGRAFLKKTFRYSGAKATVILQIAEVKPELRVIEKSQVSFEDERITLDSELMLNIIKGGIFSVRLRLPPGFEINRLTGPDIQHWDEINDANGNTVAVINFENRLSGKNSFALSLSKMISGNYRQAEVPAIRVINASKHTGSLRIKVEKGTAISILKRYGVTVSSEAASFGDQDSNFKILRPDWTLQLAFAVTPPWIQVTTLRNINIRAHSAECSVWFNYSIENAGVKRFRLILPANCTAPEFSGRYIRSTGRLENNSWMVELDRKVERDYRLRVHCRLKFNDDHTLSILPFVSPDSGIQTGYTALFAEASLQLKTREQNGELGNFNPRNVPARLGAGDLSNAILCFRSVGKDCQAKIALVRHQNAATLKAAVEAVKIKSLIAASGQVLTKAALTINNSNETFLPLRLPQGCTLWAALVDSSPVEAVENNGVSLIPLKQNISAGTCRQTVEFIYSGIGGSGWTLRNQDYKGPLFGLPLKNISWEVYLPEDRNYSGFGGTLKYRNELFSALAISSIRDYDTVVKQRAESEADRARKLFSLGRSYTRSGKTKEAFEVLNQATAFTGSKALQSDIRGQQLINSRIQNVYNLSQRRTQLARSRSGAEAQTKVLTTPSNNIQTLRQQLGDEELKNLQTISDKIFMQQQAAASTPRLFDIFIPWKGKKITFERALEIRKDAPLEIKFNSGQKLKITGLATPFLFAVLLLIFTAVGALMIAPEPK